MQKLSWKWNSLGYHSRIFSLARTNNKYNRRNNFCRILRYRSKVSEVHIQTLLLASLIGCYKICNLLLIHFRNPVRSKSIARFDINKVIPLLSRRGYRKAMIEVELVLGIPPEASILIQWSYYITLIFIWYLYLTQPHRQCENTVAAEYYIIPRKLWIKLF